ncbi:hypothetical protein FXF61_04385 [Pseudomonas sp. C27(2019)]|uniref:chalcone isomerase family protein n=1 Tax=Pseudomonas sp. C27(2019) TaxID=2604941 RepID=UPI00124578CA|nr:chalcone isomerase family protein [Pseudomonas sp. C27(2019)]QEY58447.1 hypothetical protein FXF61_04385 [Pseudomonas sp. C27(2019)]
MRILCCVFLLALSNLASAQLTEAGAGTARWGFFKVYDAQFFTTAGVTLEQALSEQTPARLELCYARELSVDNFIEGAQRALPESLPAELERAVSRLHAAYQPVKQGDCYHLDFQPEQGTFLVLNGKTLVQIDTLGFKALYFGIWLGEQPLSAPLKRSLIAGLKP